MALTPKNQLVEKIKAFLNSNSTEDPEKATEEFAIFLADLVQGEIKNASISGISTLVVTDPVTGSGTGTQVEGTGKLF